MFLLSDAEAERDILNQRLAVAEKQAHGMRGAYECIVEALINATVKVAETEERASSLEADRSLLVAQRDTLSAQLASLSAQHASLSAQHASLSAQLAETTLRLEAVLQSTSWRITRPLREAVEAFSQTKRALRALGGPT